MALTGSKNAKSKKKGSKLKALKNLVLGSSEKPAKKGKKAAKAAAKSTAKKAKGKAASPEKGKGKKALKSKSKTVDRAEAAKNAIEALSAPSESAAVSSSGAICMEPGCENLSTSGGYCRLHYIKNWKKIKRKELILKEGKLNRYIEELVAKYPDKYIEAIRQDLTSDKEFGKVIHDLELDEGIDDFEVETESVDNLIDSIRRDMDDDGEY